MENGTYKTNKAKKQEHCLGLALLNILFPKKTQKNTKNMIIYLRKCFVADLPSFFSLC